MKLKVLTSSTPALGGCSTSIAGFALFKRRKRYSEEPNPPTRRIAWSL